MPALQPIDLVQLGLWFLAGLISLYFSFGSARIWTSISTGFFLIFVDGAYLLAPWGREPRLEALHAVIGTLAILAITHGLQEYYVFSRTMEAGGSKAAVYLTALAVVAASFVFLLLNPAPDAAVLRHIRMVANVNWVFLTLINLDLLRRIYDQVRGTPVAGGFVALGVVFALIFLWRGADLYLQVYGWDEAWPPAVATFGGSVAPATLGRIEVAELVRRFGGLAASLAAGGTFAFLFRRLR